MVQRITRPANFKQRKLRVCVRGLDLRRRIVILVIAFILGLMVGVELGGYLD